MKLIHKELTYKIIGCIYDIHNALGAGLDEESYHIALVKRLEKNNLSFQTKVIKYIEHRGVKVHKFIADIIVEDTVILELKHTQEPFQSAHFLQIIAYLKCWKKDLGLLVNFGHPKAEFKRIIFNPKNVKLEEDYTEVKHAISTKNQQYLNILRDIILLIEKMYQTGYKQNIYKALLTTELTCRNIPFSLQTTIPIEYDGQIIRHYQLKVPIIGNSIICEIIALKEDTAIDVNRIRTYLKKTELTIGILIHFGKEKLEIIGISP